MTQMVVFYVDGTVLDSVPHSSPWSTSQDAQDACWAYCLELNVWWDSMWSGDVYCDETYVIVDTVHPDEVRAGFVIVPGDDAPLPSFGGYEVEELDWNEWQTV